jgi:hypothetical protein
MKPDREPALISADELPARPPEPAALYFPACGVLCDAFWWARRRTIADADPAGSRVSDRSNRS